MKATITVSFTLAEGETKEGIESDIKEVLEDLLGFGDIAVTITEEE